MLFRNSPCKAALSSVFLVVAAGLFGIAGAQVTICASVALSGALGDGDSPPSGVGAKISADGRFVVFVSQATNLTADSPNGLAQIFRKDLITGTVDLVSLSATGGVGNGNSYNPGVSADGRFVTFTSFASDLIPGSSIPIPPGTGGDNNGVKDVFVRDMSTGITTLVSVATGGTQGNAESDSSAISADGRYIAFRSVADNLTLADSNGLSDVFVRDTVAQTTTMVSVNATGGPSNAASGFFQVAISPNGRYIGFTSGATNLVSGDTNNASDVFVRDLAAGLTRRVSVASGNGQANGGSYTCAFDASGRFVVFSSDASNLVKRDTNGYRDVFLRDTVGQTTTLISVDSSAKQGNWPSGATNDGWGASAISEDGRYVAFQSTASNLTQGQIADRNNASDIFVRDRDRSTTTCVSLSPAGAIGSNNSLTPSLSANGAYVAFASQATNLVNGDTNGFFDFFVRGPAR